MSQPDPGPFASPPEGPGPWSGAPGSPGALAPPPGAPGSPPGAPAPPPGPGVQPPFVAAPIEGRRRRLGIGLGIAGGLLAACCGLGGAAGVGLLLLGQEVLNEQAQRTVEDYLAAVVEQDWEAAYDRRCAADQDAEPLSQFTSRQSAQPRIEEYEVRDLRIESGEDVFGAGDLTVPAEVTYADGTDTVLEIPLEQNPQTGEFEVCGQITEA